MASAVARTSLATAAGVAFGKRVPPGARRETRGGVRNGSRRFAFRSIRSAAVRVRASSEEEDDVNPGEPGFFGEDDFDGNPGPFVRPEGSPFFASYTDPTVWRLMQETLVEGEVEQILPAKAKLLAENDGWTLVDIRPYPDYCERHAWGAVNAQLYAPMEVNNLAAAAKAAATLALFPERIGKGYVNVECNEFFLDEMMEATEPSGGWGSKVILYCGTGGVIGQPDLNYADGLQTASLIAAHELAARGWGTDNIKHMAGGLGMWDEIEGFDCGEVPDDE